MSPLDLRGPEFLVFYLCVGTGVLLTLYACRLFVEPSDSVKADFSDPYLIAFLRGGENEVLRIATISLIHRGLLQVDGSKVQFKSSHAADGVRSPLERELLLHFSTPKEAASVFTKFHFGGGMQHYSQPLEDLGLLPNSWVRSVRRLALLAGLVILEGVALVKINVALNRGRSNIGFLVVLAILFGIFAYKVLFPRLTLRGKAMVKDLRVLFDGLKGRSPASFAPNDVAMVAAVFGIAAIPVAVFPYAQTLYPKASATSSGSSCGSSCGSSGCGGGGCGGGCGGCGS